MAQYINKADVMAEIDRRIQFFMKELRNSKSDIAIALYGLKSFLDTFKTKEVNIEKEVDIEDVVHGTIDYPFIGYDFPNIYPNYKELKEYCDRKGIKDNDRVKMIVIKDM